MKLQCADVVLDLSSPKIMGVLNVTPDSFSDGGSCYVGGKTHIDMAVRRAEAMVEAGASIIDIGGESTRPGATPVALNEEMDRVLPVLEALKGIDAVLSVDTSQAEMIKASIALGAGLINDVRALRLEGALSAVSKSCAAACLMHMKGSPKTMQIDPNYADVVAEVDDFLGERVRACIDVGIQKQRILLDPGIGFGKNDEHNLTLLKKLSFFRSLDCPILVGLSRKSMIGRLLDRGLEARLAGSLGFALVALLNGANILRVHDVGETRDIVKIFELAC